MASVYSRKTKKGKTWYASLQDPVTDSWFNQRIGSFQSKTEALAEAMKRQVAIWDKNGISVETGEPIAGPKTFKQVMGEMIEDKRSDDYSAGNIEYLTQRALVICSEHYGLGDMPIQELRFSHIREFKNMRSRSVSRGKVVSGSTVNADLVAINQVLNYAEDMEYIENNPIGRKVTKLKSRQKQKEGIALDEEELRLLLGHMLNKTKVANRNPKAFPPELLYDLVVLAVDTGLRYRNIAFLKLSSIRTDSSGDLFILVPAKEAKGKQEIHQPLTDRARLIVERYMAQVSKPDGYLFEWYPDSKPVKRKNGCPIPPLAKIFRKECQAAGIRKHVTWHSLRHTTGSFLDSKLAASAGVIKSVLSHSSISVSSKYIHTDYNAKKAAIKRYGDLKLGE